MSDEYERDEEEEAIAEITAGAPPDPREHRDDVSEPIANVVMKCLQRDADDRYQTAGELGYDLEYERNLLSLVPVWP